MMQAADLWERNNPASGRLAYGPGLRTILVEREMRSRREIAIIFTRCSRSFFMSRIWLSDGNRTKGIGPIGFLRLRFQRLVSVKYSADLIVVFHVRQQYVTKMSFTQDDDMIDAFPADRTDQPFSISVFHGERGDVGRSRMPIDRSLRMRISP
jgi:hypothetical protein